MIDFGRHVRALSMIHELYSRSRMPRAIDELQRTYPEDTGTLSYIVGGLTTMGAYVQKTDRKKLRVFVAGIQTGAHALNVARGYQNYEAMLSRDGANTSFYQDAEQLIDRHVRPAMDPDDVVEFYGHSAGGAVVEVAAHILKNRNIPCEIFVSTYGAPMPGIPGCWLSQAECRRERFMNQDDPVPWIPFYCPSTGQLVVVYMLSAQLQPGVTINARPGLCRQPAGGLRVLGRFCVRAETPGLSAEIQERIQAWFERDTETLNAHDAGTYLVVMRTLQERFPAGLSLPTGARISGGISSVEPRVAMSFPLPWQTTPELVLPLEILPTSVAIDAAGRTVGVTSFTESRRMFLKMAPSITFKKVKVGPVWQVHWRGITVMESDEKKTPTTFVKYANRMLRAIGDTNTIWATAFLEALLTCFQVASSDDTLCRPTMRVDF